MASRKLNPLRRTALIALAPLPILAFSRKRRGGDPVDKNAATTCVPWLSV